MEHVKCNLCGADDAKFVLLGRCRHYGLEKKHFKLVKCRRCGLAYLNPRPDGEEIKNYYPPWYHSRAQSKVVDIEKIKFWGIPWREAMQKKAEPILRYKKIGKILDIGCGDGSLLKYLKDLGWQTYGVEINEVSARYAREVLGLNVFKGRLEDANFPEESFDVITILHVLEHLSDPTHTLRMIFPILRKDGILVVEVPNFGSFEARIFRSKWFGIDAPLPLHLYFFTPHSLKLLLVKCGFFKVEMGFIPEQTKYVAGYSESLRYCLMDWGLYPLRGQRVEAKEECMDKSNLNDSSLDSLFHFMEYIIFKPISRFMDKIGLGSNLFAAAKKKK
ncbi:hypothetical protein AMJ44_03855 [candidate division WOR-1 bacterium DG_54_3]|uniref:Class I SAM-dependent methyltransferase n=1 Tax=candidate division WOR-1 bacterium DG_54_3 TaxID=1703775 RepID=A0A0S7Y411_UNCSA|nr:MAG: hypothetical protein AMJ44_03855 [candidate division WOR-1 bacterium DG_54_3]